MNIKPVAFSLSFDGLSNALKTPINIYLSKDFNPSSNKINKEYTALWDTGSNISVISNKLANELNLNPIGQMEVDTANGKVVMNKYVISISLPNHLNIENIVVSSGNLGEGIDLLIGMDIITLGDFSITNVNGKTLFSFRFPSIKIIDYVKE